MFLPGAGSPQLRVSPRSGFLPRAGSDQVQVPPRSGFIPGPGSDHIGVPPLYGFLPGPRRPRPRFPQAAHAWRRGRALATSPRRRTRSSDPGAAPSGASAAAALPLPAGRSRGARAVAGGASPRARPSRGHRRRSRRVTSLPLRTRPEGACESREFAQVRVTGAAGFPLLCVSLAAHLSVVSTAVPWSLKGSGRREAAGRRPSGPRGQRDAGVAAAGLSPSSAGFVTVAAGQGPPAPERFAAPPVRRADLHGSALSLCGVPTSWEQMEPPKRSPG